MKIWPLNISFYTKAATRATKPAKAAGPWPLLEAAFPVTWTGAALLVEEWVEKGATETTGTTVLVTGGEVTDVVATTGDEAIIVVAAPLVTTVVSGTTAVDMIV